MEKNSGHPQPGQDWLDEALSRFYAGDIPQEYHSGWRAAIHREEQRNMKQRKAKGSSLQRLWKVGLPVAAALVLVVGSLWVGATQGQRDGDVLLRREGGNAKSMVAYDNGVEYDADLPLAEEAVSMSGGGASYSAFSSADSAPAGMEAADQEKKIVRTADLTLATTAFDTDEAAVRQLVESHGGYVESLYQYGDGSPGSLRRLSFSLRIPTENLDAFLSGAAGIGRVTARGESAVDKTVEYSDTSLRLQTQRDKMDRLQALLAQAENVTDLIEIESEIANTQYQLDSYETSLRGIDRQVERSAVSLTLVEETPAQTAAGAGVSLGERIASGWEASLEGLGRFFQNMLVFVIMALPVLVPLAVVGVALLVVLRRRKAKAPEAEAAPQGDEKP